MWLQLDLCRWRGAREVKPYAAGYGQPGESIDRYTISTPRSGGPWFLALVVLATSVSAGCGVQDHFYSVAPTSNNTVRQLDAKYGFGDLRFGQAPTPDMKLEYRDNLGSETYFRCASCSATASIAEMQQECQRDVKQCPLLGAITPIGRARTWVLYKFSNAKLTTVEILALSLDDNQPLLEALRYAYGPGVRRRADDFKIDNSEDWWGEYVTMNYLEPVSDANEEWTPRSTGTAVVFIRSKESSPPSGPL
jgi:hypothetical protein